LDQGAINNQSQATRLRQAREAEWGREMTALGRLDTSVPDYDVLASFGAMAGKVNTAKLLFLVCTSGLLDKPMHAILKGPSSAGKSEVRKQVLKFFPPDRIIQFTAQSEHALLDEDTIFSHRILSMAEAEATRDPASKIICSENS
jgi:hypothetical protein